MSVVTVIMPCRNATATLGATLDSLRSQSFDAWNLIAIDDCSTDETGALLKNAAREDRRIRVIQGPGQGVSAARNAGLEMAGGEFIAFLDSDDIWEPQRLAMLLWMMNGRPDVGIAFSRFAFFNDEPGDSPTESTLPFGPLSVADLLSENRVGTMSNVIVRAEAARLIGPFRQDMTHGEDREWLVRAVAMGEEIRGLDSLLLHYRTSTTGLSADAEKMHEGWRESVRTAERLYALPAPRQMRAAEAIYLRHLARRALRLGMPPRVAAGYALRGAMKSPGGFFGDPRRGALTFTAALAGLVAPGVVQSALSGR